MTFSKTLRRTLASGALAAVALTALPGCDFTFENPNATDANAVFADANGLTALAAGMRREYTVPGLSAVIRAGALSTRQLTTVVGFTDPQDFETGGASLPNTDNSIVNGVWDNMYQTIDLADQIIANADNAGELEDELLATAYFYRAAALGNLALFFEQFPVTPDREDGQSEFVSREEGLERALELLDQARGARGDEEPSNDFKTRAYGTTSFNLGKTIDAYAARFSLMLGRNDDAIAFASEALDGGDEVSLFPYDAVPPNQNPMWLQTTEEPATLRPVENFGFDPDDFVVDEDDGRMDFYLADAPTVQEDSLFVRAGLVSDLTVKVMQGFYDEPGESIPAYIPDEMRLIRAEAYVRQGQTDQAVGQINAVRTDTDDPLGLNAGLDAYDGSTSQDDLLTEIFRQRRLELFATGLGLEDSRRLGREAPPASPSFDNYTRVRNFLPYPQDEGVVNRNTPANPAI